MVPVQIIRHRLGKQNRHAFRTASDGSSDSTFGTDGGSNIGFGTDGGSNL